MLPYDVIGHISSFCKRSPIRLLDKYLYKYITKLESSDYWKDKYYDFAWEHKCLEYITVELDKKYNWKRRYFELVELYKHEPNFCKKIPDMLADQNKKIKIVELSVTELDFIPLDLLNLFSGINNKKLHALRYSACGIKYVPKEISICKSLVSLELPNNNITTLPDSIGELFNLVVLNVSGNRLTKLPDSISKLQKLRKLDISFNNIKDISSIYKLLKLQTINLNFTDLEEIDFKFFKDKRLICSYCFRDKCKFNKRDFYDLIMDRKESGLYYNMETPKDLEDISKVILSSDVRKFAYLNFGKFSGLISFEEEVNFFVNSKLGEKITKIDTFDDIMAIVDVGLIKYLIYGEKFELKSKRIV